MHHKKHLQRFQQRGTGKRFGRNKHASWSVRGRAFDWPWLWRADKMIYVLLVASHNCYKYALLPIKYIYCQSKPINPVYASKASRLSQLAKNARLWRRILLKSKLCRTTQSWVIVYKIVTGCFWINQFNWLYIIVSSLDSFMKHVKKMAFHIQCIFVQLRPCCQYLHVMLCSLDINCSHKM